MAETVWDVVVVGAGVEGSAIAYTMAKNGLRTLQLEQFHLPHSRGSSHGQTRITRRAYEDDFYTHMMGDAFSLWAQLEREAEVTLYRKTGLLVLGKLSDHDMVSIEKSLLNASAPYRKLTPADLQSEYPMLSYDPDYGAILDPDGGILRADKAVRAFQAVFKKFGGTLNDGEPVTSIIPGQTVIINTTKGIYKTKQVVLAVGPWAPKFLQTLRLNLPLKALRVAVLYWKEQNDGVHGSNTFPTTLDHAAFEGKGIYSLPADEYPGYVKVCLHTGPETDPEKRDAVEWKWIKDVVSNYVRKHYKQLVPESGIEEACIYTVTPDENAIIDFHPQWKNIIVAAGFSGYGFKLSPAIGKMVFELATEKSPSYNIEPFKIGRFLKKENITSKI